MNLLQISIVLQNWISNLESGVSVKMCSLFPLSWVLQHMCCWGRWFLPQLSIPFPHTTDKEVELLWFLLCEIMWCNDSEGTVHCCTDFALQGQPAPGLLCLCAPRVACLGFCGINSPDLLRGLCVLKAKLGTCAEGSVPLGCPDSTLLSRWAPLLKAPPALWASTRFCPTAAKLTGKWWRGSCSSMPSWTLG